MAAPHTRQLDLSYDTPSSVAVATRPDPRRSALAVRASASYEAGAHTRRTVGWRAPTASPNAAILANLATLRDRSRAATRNDGYAKGAIDKLVTNIIGTGIKPLSQAPDPEFRRLVHARWTAWTDESDADGLLDFYGQQAQATRCWLDGGEAFARLRPRLLEDGLTVPLQVQVLEPEMCPHTHDVVTAGARIRAGIEFNGIGKRVAYWFYPHRPEQSEFDYYGNVSELRRIPADSVIHVYDPQRAGQIRGLPHLTQSLIRLLGIDKFDDAVSLRQQIANLFVAFVKSPVGSGDASALYPLTNAPVDTLNDVPLAQLEPGLVQELDPGDEIEFSNPPTVQGYADFMRQQLVGVAVASGVPYEVLTGDMRGVNDRTVRVILHEFRRRMQAYQHQIVAHQFCRRIWRAWLERGFLSGALPTPPSYVADPRPWLAAKWMPQSWPYINPVQDVDAQKAAVRAGFTTRSAVVSEYGEDAEAIDQEQAADNERADDLGLRYDSDGRVDNTVRAVPEDPADPTPPPPNPGEPSPSWAQKGTT